MSFAAIDSAQLSANASDLTTYLQILFKNAPPETYVNITTIKKGTKTPENFQVRVNNLQLIEHKILTRGDAYNIFIQVSTLKHRPLHGRGTEDLVAGTNALWADIDNPDIDRVLAALNKLGIQPTLINASGHGVHAYWILKSFSTDVPKIRAKNKALQQQINQLLGTNDADSVFDAARIMRVPGTWNVKNGQPKPVTILAHHKERVYDFDQFIEASVENDTPIDVWDTDELPVNFLDDLRDKDKKIVARIENEESARKTNAPLTPDGKIDHSANDSYIVTRLLALGYTPNVIISVLMHESWLSGTKYRETGRYDYVIRTVDSAWKHFQRSPGQYFTGKMFRGDLIAQRIQQTQPFIYTASKLWRYVNGVYLPDGEEVARKYFVEKLGDRWQSRYAEEAVIWLKSKFSTPLELTNQHNGLINCQNGMLNTATNELVDHASEYLSLAQIPVVYNPTANTDQIDSFFDELLPHDSIDLFWEFVGSVFVTDHYWPKYFMLLIGKPHTGKSKILNLLIAFYGHSNVVSLSFQTLAENRFASANLFGKLANIFDDLNESEAQDTGRLKNLTGDSPTNGERKFGDTFSFLNRARLIFSANHMPPVKNADDALFDRALIISCANQFIGTRADKSIVDKMSTSQNLSAMLLRATQGLQRLAQRNTLELSKSALAMQDEYRYAADTVHGFIQAQTILSENPIKNKLTRDAMYSYYKHWCTFGNRRQYSEEKFYRRMTENLDVFGLTAEYKTLDTGERRWCYVGREVLPVAQDQRIF